MRRWGAPRSAGGAGAPRVPAGWGARCAQGSGAVGAAWARPGAPPPPPRRALCSAGRAAVRGGPRPGWPRNFSGIRKQDPGCCCCCFREERGTGRAGWPRGACTHPQPIARAQRGAGSSLPLLLLPVCGRPPAAALVPRTWWLGQPQKQSWGSSGSAQASRLLTQPCDFTAGTSPVCCSALLEQRAKKTLPCQGKGFLTVEYESLRRA